MIKIHTDDPIHHSYDGITIGPETELLLLGITLWTINISEMWVLSLQSPCTMIYCSKVMNIGIFSPISSLLPKNDHAEIVECIEQRVQGLDFWIPIAYYETKLIGPQSSSDSEETISATLITLWTKYKHNMLKILSKNFKCFFIKKIWTGHRFCRQTNKQEDSYIPPPQILFVGEGR